MTLQFAQIDSFSGIKSFFTQHLNQTIFGAVSPTAVLNSPVAGVSLTQSCSSSSSSSSDKIDEGVILVLPDVLTSCMVGNHNNNNNNNNDDDKRIFQSHLFLSQYKEEEENQKL